MLFIEDKPKRSRTIKGFPLLVETDARDAVLGSKYLDRVTSVMQRGFLQSLDSLATGTGLGRAEKRALKEIRKYALREGADFAVLRSVSKAKDEFRSYVCLEADLYKKNSEEER